MRKSARVSLGKPVVIEHKGDKHPQIMIEDADGKILDVHYLPAGAQNRGDWKASRFRRASCLLISPEPPAGRRISPADCRV